MLDTKNPDLILCQYPQDQTYLLSVLHQFQDTYGYVSSDHIKKIAGHFGISSANVFSEITFYDKFTVEKTGEIIFQVCDGTVCHSKGSAKLLEELMSQLKIQPGETTEDGKYTLKTVHCMGECAHAPVSDVDHTISDIDLLDCEYEKKLLVAADSIEQYEQNDGFAGLKEAFALPRKKMILDKVKESGLRGCSGSGFPVGDKWEAAYHAKGRSSNFIDKYVVANGDEGDPGAFMDRWLMEENPYLILEGMVIAGLCVNANKGYIYVRDEYGKAVERLETAILEMAKAGLIGRRILDSDYNFDIEVVRAARSYVCGEESAMMESIEGKSGVPRIKPPFPTFRGILEQPTLINNVETFANIPFILRKDCEKANTKLFSLSGAVKNKGLVEVPIGKLRLRELIYDIGGGIEKGSLKCVQVGGPSGAYITEEELDILMDFDDFAEKGFLLGSGGIVVMDDTICAVDTLKHTMGFLADESCGTCTPCREGLRIILEILNRITTGKGELEDIETLEHISFAAKIASRCALGKSIGNPILSLLCSFEEELKGHIIEQKCPLHICKMQEETQ